jgi:hypothetical protein
MKLIVNISVSKYYLNQSAVQKIELGEIETGLFLMNYSVLK